MIDLSAIARGTRAYNFHSHTQFCDGRAPMADMVQAAAAAGFEHWGFSPHSPVPYESPCNMSLSDVDVYLAEVDRLRSAYNGVINLYASMEVDYMGPEWGPSHSYFASLPLDYRIGSVHFVPSDNGPVDVDGSFASFATKMDRYFHNDIRHVVKLFYSQSMMMVEAGGFDIIGHFDKIGSNASQFRPGIEDETWYKILVDDLVDLIIDRGIIAEVNTKAWDKSHRLFPSRRYIERLLQAGTVLAVNSDAHFPDKVDAGRSAAFQLIDNIKLHNS